MTQTFMTAQESMVSQICSLRYVRCANLALSIEAVTIAYAFGDEGPSEHTGWTWAIFWSSLIQMLAMRTVVSGG